MSFLVQIRNGVGTYSPWGGGILSLLVGPGPLDFKATESLAGGTVAQGTLIAGADGVLIGPGGSIGPSFPANTVTSQASSVPPASETQGAPGVVGRVLSNVGDQQLFVPGTPPDPRMVGAAAATSGVIPPGQFGAGNVIVGAAPWPVAPTPFVPPKPTGIDACGFVTITFSSRFVLIGDFTILQNGR